jgi:SOS-response transcriptional repressor LexA
MQRKGLSAAKLARELDVVPSLISRWINGSRKPSIETCQRLAEIFGLTALEVWQAAGYVQRSAEVTAVASVAAMGTPGPPMSLREEAARLLSELPVKIPVIDQKASAGPGQSLMEYVYLEPAAPSEGSVIAIRVAGDSMEPEIHDGDTVIVDKELAPEPNDIVVAAVDDDVFVKHYRLKGDAVILEGRTGEIPGDEVNIIGVVIEIIHHKRRARRNRPRN